MRKGITRAPFRLFAEALRWLKSLILFGAPGPTRTGDLRFRKPLLYPAELRAQEGTVGQAD
jgi:hypothetical protein